MAPQVDVLKAKVTLANARQNLINSNNGIKLAKSYFNNLLNRAMDKKVTLEDILSFEEINFDLPSLAGEAFDNRPEIGEVESRLRMAEEGVKIARSNFFPQVMFIGNWDRQKGAEIPVGEWEESWNAVIQVNMDIWDWGENRNELRRAKAQHEQLRSSLTLLKNGIELEVHQAYLELLAAKERIKVQEQAIREAERNFRDTSLRFKEGIATNTDVLDAQTMLSQTRSDYYRALYDYNLALAALERAVGRSSSESGEKK
jgi:outer membrane protein TolC